MSKFTGYIVVKPNHDSSLAELVLPIAYESDLLGREIIIPAGFVTDFASVPRALWNILPPFGRYTAASVLHDFAYTTQFCTRKQADDVFFEAMTVLDVPWVTRWAMWSALRQWGWIAWRNHKKELERNKA